jgi:Cu(I)/Ag(I) efflux system membrane protein CusA/SilA
MTLCIIVVLLYLNFRRFSEVSMIMLTLPLALVGGVQLMHYLNFNLSVAVGVGFIALAGVAVEISVIMLTYLNQAYEQMKLLVNPTDSDLKAAITQGAGKRVRPVMMTAVAIIVGLLPIMFGSGTGSEVMRRIAAPMVGGMVSALALTLFVLPTVYFLWKKSQLTKGSNDD